MPLTATGQEVGRLSEDRIKACFPRGDCGYKVCVHRYKRNGNLIGKIYNRLKKKNPFCLVNCHLFCRYAHFCTLFFEGLLKLLLWRMGSSNILLLDMRGKQYIFNSTVKAN